MFKAVDMNDDGKISFDEYFTIIHVTLNADKEMQKLIEAFEVSHFLTYFVLDGRAFRCQDSNFMTQPFLSNLIT